jgi:hypothetical protein
MNWTVQVRLRRKGVQVRLDLEQKRMVRVHGERLNSEQEGVSQSEEA